MYLGDLQGRRAIAVDSLAAFNRFAGTVGDNAGNDRDAARRSVDRGLDQRRILAKFQGVPFAGAATDGGTVRARPDQPLHLPANEGMVDFIIGAKRRCSGRYHAF